MGGGCAQTLQREGCCRERLNGSLKRSLSWWSAHPALSPSNNLRLHFLNKLANACRGSFGPEDDVSRSITVRAANNSQSFRALLFKMRAVMVFRHSNRAAGSKKLHMRQVCRSALHFGHELSLPTELCP